MTSQAARSISPFAAELLTGGEQRGAVIGHGYVLFDHTVLAVTPVGALRMPNGIEADLAAVPGDSVIVGHGRLSTAWGTIVPGLQWNPKPVVRFSLVVTPRPRLQLDELVGRGPGLTPLGDDILIGYLAGLALAGVPARPLAERAAAAARRTTTLAGTLLLLAALGCLPEGAHRLLSDGDIKPLLCFGATSGQGIALGLALAAPHVGNSERASISARLTLELDGLPNRYEIGIVEHAGNTLIAQR